MPRYRGFRPILRVNNSGDRFSLANLAYGQIVKESASHSVLFLFDESLSFNESGWCKLTGKYNESGSNISPPQITGDLSDGIFHGVTGEWILGFPEPTGIDFLWYKDGSVIDSGVINRTGNWQTAWNDYEPRDNGHVIEFSVKISTSGVPPMEVKSESYYSCSPIVHLQNQSYYIAGSGSAEMISSCSGNPQPELVHRQWYKDNSGVSRVVGETGASLNISEDLAGCRVACLVGYFNRMNGLTEGIYNGETVYPSQAVVALSEWTSVIYPSSSSAPTFTDSLSLGQAYVGQELSVSTMGVWTTNGGPEVTSSWSETWLDGIFYCNGNLTPDESMIGRSASIVWKATNALGTGTVQSNSYTISSPP